MEYVKNIQAFYYGTLWVTDTLFGHVLVCTLNGGQKRAVYEAFAGWPVQPKICGFGRHSSNVHGHFKLSSK